MTSIIYVHQTRAIPYAEAIALGLKPIETRTRDTLRRFVGQRVLIARTMSGRPTEIIGSVVIESGTYYSASELDSMRDQTLIPPGSKFDCHGRGKWGYTLTHAVTMDPVPLSSLNVTKRTRTYAVIDD